MIIKKGRCIRNMEYLEKKEFAFDYLDSTDKDNFSILNAIYPFSTENLNYFTKELLQDKKVLLTGSSDDQILLAQLHKAKLITHFDLNPFVEYFYDLKKAAIKELEIEDFLSYFHYSRKEVNSFSKTIYNQIRKSILSNSLDFWDSLYQKYDVLFLRKKLFQFEELNDEQDYKKFIPYLAKENYEKLKKQGNFVPVDFIMCNVLDLYQNLKLEYDVIYFSNIFSRIGNDRIL